MKSPQSLVFIVDDDVSARTSLANLLRSVNLGVQMFPSASEFLAFRRPEVPSCLILDVRLPGVSGLDLQRRMSGSTSPLPIIFVTGHGDIPMSVEAMKAGAVEFLTKPYRDQAVLDAVHLALERDGHCRKGRAEVDELQRRYSSLTERERSVMALVVAGLLNNESPRESARARSVTQAAVACA